MEEHPPIVNSKDVVTGHACDASIIFVNEKDIIKNNQGWMESDTPHTVLFWVVYTANEKTFFLCALTKDMMTGAGISMGKVDSLATEIKFTPVSAPVKSGLLRPGAKALSGQVLKLGLKKPGTTDPEISAAASNVETVRAECKALADLVLHIKKLTPRGLPCDESSQNAKTVLDWSTEDMISLSALNMDGFAPDDWDVIIATIQARHQAKEGQLRLAEVALRAAEEKAAEANVSLHGIAKGLSVMFAKQNQKLEEMEKKIDDGNRLTCPNCLQQLRDHIRGVQESIRGFIRHASSSHDR